MVPQTHWSDSSRLPGVGYREQCYPVKYLVIIVLLCFATITMAQTLSNYSFSWLGATVCGYNDEPDPYGYQARKVPDYVDSLYVSPEGHCFTNAFWDEGAAHCSYFDSNGNVGRRWMREYKTDGGPGAVAFDGTYFYDANGEGFHRDRAFQNRYPADGNAQYRAGDNQVIGMAYDGGELFVASRADNRIHVYRTSDMNEVRSFSVANPGRLAVEPGGDLWMIEMSDKRTGSKIVRYAKTGAKRSQEITDVNNPVAIAVDYSDNNRLWVASYGDKNYRRYRNIKSAPTYDRSFGVVGGIFSSPWGQAGTFVTGQASTFRFEGPVGIGTDSAGNIYTADYLSGTNVGAGGGTSIMKFNPDGTTRLWVHYGFVFEDSATADPLTDGVDVYSVDRHYQLDYSNTTRGTEWSYKGFTGNFSKYPHDWRNTSGWNNPSSTLITIQGKKFLWTAGQAPAAAHHVMVYRFDSATDGEAAIPCAMFAFTNGSRPGSPGSNGWIWTDADADGQMESGEYESFSGDIGIEAMDIDKNGTLWGCSSGNVYRLPFNSFVAGGKVPKWRPADLNQMTTSAPAPFTNDLMRILYDPDADRLILFGYNGSQPYETWGCAGRIAAGYNNWMAGNRTPSWTQSNLYWSFKDGSGQDKPWIDMHLTDSVCRVDKYFMISYFGGVDVGGVYVWDATNGSFVGKMVPPNDVTCADTDKYYNLHATQRANGEIVILAGDHYYGKQIMYRWGNTPPPLTIRFDPPGGEYPGSVTVTITCSDPTATISYTTDGSTPSPTIGTRISSGGQVTLTSTTTLKAMAFKSGMTNSAVASTIYTIIPPQVATPILNPGSMNFSDVVTVNISCSTPGAIVRYTTDGTDPTLVSPTVLSDLTFNQTTTLKAKAWKDGMTPSAIATAVYIKGDIIYSFANFSADGAAVDGTHSGVNFGTGQWCYTVGYAGLSGCGYYSTDVTSRTFTLPAGKVLKSIKVGSDTVGSTWTVRDSASGNAQKSGTIAAANTPVVVTTGWANASGTITVTSSNGWNTCWDDITYGDPIEQVATPIITPPSGSPPLTVTITCSTPGASIRYTTNGTTPTTTTGTLIASGGTVTITSTTTLKVVAYKSGMTTSPVVTATYAIAQVSKPVLTPASGTAPLDVTVSCATSGASMRYTIDGSTPTETHGTLVTGPIGITNPCTLKVIAYKSGMTTSDIATGTYTQGKVATPTMTPTPPHTFTGASVSVTLACATTGATIYYTTNGSTPTSGSTLYTGPFSVSATTTVKAVAVKSGLLDSDVATGVYTKSTIKQTVKVEAENGSFSGGVYDHGSASGGKAVGWMGGVGAYSQVTANVTTAGNYNLTIRYVTDVACSWTVYVNGVDRGNISLPACANWDTFRTTAVKSIPLTAGNNTIKLQCDSGDTGDYLDTDYFQVVGPQ